MPDTSVSQRANRQPLTEDEKRELLRLADLRDTLTDKMLAQVFKRSTATINSWLVKLRKERREAAALIRAR